MKRIKLYEVEFLNYTNPMENTIKTTKDDYIDVKKPIIISENDIDFVNNNIVGGIKSLKFVGYSIELKNIL